MLKSIQSGTYHTEDTTDSIPISEVDVDKSFVTVSYNGYSLSSHDDHEGMVQAHIEDSGDEIYIYRYAGGSFSPFEADISWFVTEYEDGVNVQVVTGSITGNLQNTHTISEVNEDRTYLIVWTAGRNNPSHAHPKVWLEDETTIKAERYDDEYPGTWYSIQVIEILE